MTNLSDDLPGRLSAALTACPSLEVRSDERDRLWMALEEAVCTRSHIWVTPLGSARPVRVTPEYGADELIAAMTWLQGHELEARGLDATALLRKLRGAATRGANGSARMAQRDALRGLTNVDAGQLVRWADLDEWGAA